MMIKWERFKSNYTYLQNIYKILQSFYYQFSDVKITKNCLIL